MSDKLIDLKEKYLLILTNILKITKNYNYTEDSDEACEKYIELIENRDVYFKDLQNIANAMQGINADKNDKDVMRIDTKIKETAKQIYEIDKKNMLLADKMMERLKKHLKESKVNTKMFSAYNNLSLFQNYASNFDSKQ